LTFSGSSGGALVSVALGTGIPIRELFEYVLEQLPACKLHPYRMFPAVEVAMKKFLPKNVAESASGRVRILLTRIGMKPPFITGEVVDQYGDWWDVFHRARASCHVPVLNPLPYRHEKRLYFDGLIWSSLLVPWGGDLSDLVVKISATSAPLTDIRAPLSPLWWILLPPNLDALRGLFWLGYRDAAQWFSEPAPLDMCGFRCDRVPRSRRNQRPEEVDALDSSRSAKQVAARKLVLVKPKPVEEALPENDPVTGQAVGELIQAYRLAVDRSFKAALLVLLLVAGAVAAVIFWT